jgi:CysZ protein
VTRKAQGRSKPPGFFAGVRCFFAGFGLLLSSPAAFALALVPAVVILLLFFALALVAVTFITGWIERGFGEGGLWVGVVQVLASVAAVVVSALFALALAQPASGPALESLVRVTEKKLGMVERRPTPFLTDIWRSAVSASIGLFGGAIAFTVLFLIGLIPGAAVVTVPLKFVAATVLVAWDVCDYPLNVRGLPIADRIRFVLRNAPAVLGFGAGIALVALIPCGFLAILPAGVAGATKLVSEIEPDQC